MDRGRHPGIEFETAEIIDRLSQVGPSNQVEAGSDPTGAGQVLQRGVHLRHREVQISHLRDSSLSQRQER